MDMVQLSDSSVVIEGLSQMLIDRIGTDCDGDIYYARSWVSVTTACFVVTVAKLAEDKPEWFPRGKWATIQAIETRIHDAIMTPAD